MTLSSRFNFLLLILLFSFVSQQSAFYVPIGIRSFSDISDGEEDYNYDLVQNKNDVNNVNSNYYIDNNMKRNFAFVPSRGKKLQERFNFQGSRGKRSFAIMESGNEKRFSFVPARG
uniref:Uncharacterized protein n=1 Tax=Parastrongyloides trichosuri TaxID=131310 RepID=A0A0N4ZYM2_PARTI